MKNKYYHNADRYYNSDDGHRYDNDVDHTYQYMNLSFVYFCIG